MDGSPVVSVSPDDTVASAALQLQCNHVSALVVLDDDDRLVGLLTERDLLQVIIDGDDPATTPVQRRMATDVVTIAPDTDPMEARELMGRHAVRHLPVVDGRPLRLHRGPPRHHHRRRPDPERPARPAAPPVRPRVPPALGVQLVGGGERGGRRRLRDPGPAFVKLGQIMASSSGVFPEPLADACQRTLDEVPPFDSATARRIIEEDLGHRPEELFRFFDDKPLSAASIGQVHTSATTRRSPRRRCTGTGAGPGSSAWSA